MSRMRSGPFGLIFLLLLWTPTLWALRPPGYKLAHPIGWMHQLPTGEMPGWNSPAWIGWSVNHANIWNAPIDLVNNNTGDTLSYEADFAQTSLTLEAGFELSKDWALSFEVPYTHRAGGVLDLLIDNFHIFIGSDRFNRHEFPRNRNQFSVKRNGTEQLEENEINGIGNYKAKLKWWPLKWKSPRPGICECGFGASAQVKIPTASYRKGLSSSYHDYSFMWHLGIPLFTASAIWMSSSVTYTPDNPLLEGWPRREWHQMYEMSFDLSVSQQWGLILQLRTESPILNKEQLSIVDDGSSDEEQLLRRIASGWNSLVHWRGSQAMGFRYLMDEKTTFHFLFVEDWGLGYQDDRGDGLYVNNAPDVEFIVQGVIGF